MSVRVTDHPVRPKTRTDVHFSDRATLLKAVHVGPDVYSFGGTQSVIRTLRDECIGADRVAAISTWDGASHTRNAVLVGRAFRIIASAPAPSLFHFHVSNGGGWLREGLLISVAKRLGHHIVVHLHGFEFPEFASAHPNIVGPLMRKADHVICLSRRAEEVLRDRLGVNEVTVLPNPVPLDLGAAGAETTQPVALFAGSVGTRKGVDVLARAWEMLLESGIEGECHIVGPIVDFTPPPLDRLIVRGAVHPDAVGELIRRCRVVVLPSRAEAMPMILTEALAAARPFVATDVGGTADITPDPSMIIPVDDVAALADRVGNYLRDPVAAGEAGRAGQRYIAATRSPAVIGRRLNSIYRSIEGTS